MENRAEVNSLLEKDESIQGRFFESLITGHRDVLFRETKRKPESEVERLQADIDSQRGTF
jgi:hypothetical protein